MTRDEVPEDKILQNPVKGKQAKITLFTCVSWQNNQERLLVGAEIEFKRLEELQSKVKKHDSKIAENRQKKIDKLGKEIEDLRKSLEG